MDLDEFQKGALQTDNTAHNYEQKEARKDIVVAILGVAGELGTLATAYKKFLRDGPAYRLYATNVKEELGDLLWYVAVLADKFELRLSEIAASNLQKVNERWGGIPAVADGPLYDEGFPPNEQLPRSFSIKFEQRTVEGNTKVTMDFDGIPLGNSLTDNSDFEDGYRYHDAFHLAFAVMLGWSPVLRKLMGRKRRSDKKVDENQDGGRAIVIEEGIAAYVFEYGEAHQGLEGVRSVDFDVLKTVKSMTQRLEVSTKSWSEWERAIMAAYEIFRSLKFAEGGWVDGDLVRRTIRFRPLG